MIGPHACHADASERSPVDVTREDRGGGEAAEAGGGGLLRYDEAPDGARVAGPVRSAPTFLAARATQKRPLWQAVLPIGQSIRQYDLYKEQLCETQPAYCFPRCSHNASVSARLQASQSGEPADPQLAPVSSPRLQLAPLQDVANCLGGFTPEAASPMRAADQATPPSDMSGVSRKRHRSSTVSPSGSAGSRRPIKRLMCDAAHAPASAVDLAPPPQPCQRQPNRPHGMPAGLLSQQQARHWWPSERNARRSSTASR